MPRAGPWPAKGIPPSNIACSFRASAFQSTFSCTFAFTFSFIALRTTAQVSGGENESRMQQHEHQKGGHSAYCLERG